MRGARAPERGVRIFEDSRRLSLAVAGRFVAAAAAAVRDRGSFAVALSGGRTPRELYRVLASEFRDFVAWPKVHFFWSDERYVPPTDRESNVRLARETLLDSLGLPPENVHPPRTDLPEPDEAAAVYEREIA
ncbi:MAG: 6-phosphogluconolactonase, partial [Vicinamibacteria bacterium]